MEIPGLFSQQVAGQPCHLCGERILVKVEGRGCVNCCIAWHRTCTETPLLCPGCGQDPAVAAKAIAETQRREVWAAVDRGRRLYFILLGLHILGALILLFGFSITRELTTDASEKETFFSEPVIRAAFSFAFFFLFWLGAYFGVTAARYMLAVGAWTPIVLVILLAIGKLAPGGLHGVSLTRGTPRKGSPEAVQRETVQARGVWKSLTFGGIVVLSLSAGTALYTVIICCFNSTLRNYEVAWHSRHRARS